MVIILSQNQITYRATCCNAHAIVSFIVGEIETTRAQRNPNTLNPDFSTLNEMSDSVISMNNVLRYNKKRYQVRRPNTAGYGYHRRRLRINQELRGSYNSSSICAKSGEHNLVSSSVHRNLLILILGSFVPLLLLQGNTYCIYHI